MQAAAEISMYPLDADYVPPIDDFIDRLHRHEGLTLRTSATSTQVFGPYDDLMAALTAEMRRSYERHGKAAFVIKVLHGELDPEYRRP